MQHDAHVWTFARHLRDRLGYSLYGIARALHRNPI